MDYFKYNGICYYAGTIVKFKDGRYGKYRGYGDGFDYVVPQGEEYIETNCITCNGADLIEEIIKPIKFADRKFVKIRKDTESNDMFYAWIWYIVYMLFISITTDAILGWIVGTIVFVIYRHKKLYKEVNKK